jgi:hypothetical protein
LEVEPNRESAKEFTSLEAFGAVMNLHKILDTTYLTIAAALDSSPGLFEICHVIILFAIIYSTNAPLQQRTNGIIESGFAEIILTALV